MNWLERARREIGGSAARPTANTAEGNPTAVTAVLSPAVAGEPSACIGSNGSAQPRLMPDSEALREIFEERAAILEFDGGLSRGDAEQAAWALVAKLCRRP
jgi:hypothetical protein